MSSEATPLLSRASQPNHAKVGEFHPSSETDKRGPCPVLNALANHGHLPRDGRNITGDAFVAGLAKAGIASTLCAILSRPVFIPFEDPKLAYLREPRSFLQKIWYYMQYPWALFFGGYGLWDGRKVNNKPVLDLDHLARHGVVEHDISMTRYDTAQEEGANALQTNLVDALLALESPDGYIDMKSMAKFRKQRIQQQLEANPGLYYGPWEHQTACSEIALILHAFGDGQRIRADVLSALFREERLPYKEGWKSRWWWKLGVLEMGRAAAKVKKAIGLKVE